MRVISFGAGVQSSAMVVLAGLRDSRLFDAMGAWPDVAIFSDPGNESPATYSHLEFMLDWAKDKPIDIHTTSAGNIKEDWLNAPRFASIPAFTKNPDGTAGMLRRNCTQDYKIHPIARKIKGILGLGRRQRITSAGLTHVDMWLGISLDEVQRMRDSGPIKWQRLHYPLIEMRWRRIDCLNYMASVGLPEPPKSACIFCPYHSDGFWLEMKRRDRASFDEAGKFDRAIRHLDGRGGIKNPVYLHSSLEPLDEVELSEAQLDLFGNECEGYCGL